MELTWAVINTSFLGIHNYPDSDTYLKHPHHHVFNIKVSIQQRHNDRDIEFHELRTKVDKIIDKLYNKNSLGQYILESRSCEQISEELIQELSIDYIDRQITVSVFEDDMCGSIKSKVF